MHSNEIRIKKRGENNSKYFALTDDNIHLYNDKDYVKKPSEMEEIIEAWNTPSADFYRWSMDKYNTLLIFNTNIQRCDGVRSVNRRVFYLDKYLKLLYKAAKMTIGEKFSMSTMFSIFKCVQQPNTLNMDIVILLFGDIVFDSDHYKLKTQEGKQILRNYLNLLEKMDKNIKEKNDLEIFKKNIEDKHILD